MNQDLRQSKPRLLRELIFWPDRSEDATGYRIEVPSRGKFFSIGYTEFVFIHALDGNTSVAQACGRVAKKLSREAVSQTQADGIVRWLLRNDLVERTANRAFDHPQNDPKGWLDRLNPFWIKLPLPDVHRWIKPAAHATQFLFSATMVLVAVFLILFAVIAIGLQADRFIASSATIFSPYGWIGMLVSWMGLKLVHELGHAAAAARYGCPVRKAGIVFVLFAPLAYVDVTACWRLRSRWQRIVIACAGMYVELTIAALAAILWCVIDSPWVCNQLFSVIVTASVATILFNANPLMRFDGYYILVDLLRIPNLATEGNTALANLASRFFYARAISRGWLAGWRSVFVVAYGIAAMGWRVVICVSLCIAAWWMFHGLGMILIAIGLVSWVGRPAFARLKAWDQRRRLDPSAALRAAVVTSGLSFAIGWSIFGMPIASALHAPAVVDVPQGAILRSGVDGFVKSIGVNDGDVVGIGDEIMRLENEDLRERQVELQSKIAQSRIRKRQETEARNIASAQVHESDRRTLEQQLAQVLVQIESLTIRAHRAGRILAPRIADLIGTYVREGDELVTVDGPLERRVIASIAGTDIRQAAGHVGQRVQILAASLHRAEGTLHNIKPLASNRLRYESLSSTAGGELVVQLDSESVDGEEFKLVEPRFEATIQLDQQSSTILPLGQTVKVGIGQRKQTIARRMSIWLDRLVREAKPKSGVSF